MTIKQLLLTSFTLVAVFLISSCGKDDACIAGEGTISTTTLTVSSFTGIDLSIAADVTITQGATQEVVLTGHPNIISAVTISVNNGNWEINFSDNDCYEDYELTIQVTVPEISDFNVSGSGTVVVNDFSEQSNLDLDLSGSGRVTLNEFEGPTRIDANISGSGTITTNELIASLESIDLNISGSGNYIGFEARALDCTVDVTGSGKAEITAFTTLDVTISGSGDVFYKGTPTISQDISGSGTLTDAN